jgi:hypothetical protein
MTVSPSQINAIILKVEMAVTDQFKSATMGRFLVAKRNLVVGAGGFTTSTDNQTYLSDAAR